MPTKKTALLEQFVKLQAARIEHLEHAVYSLISEGRAGFQHEDQSVKGMSKEQHYLNMIHEFQQEDAKLLEALICED